MENIYFKGSDPEWGYKKVDLETYFDEYSKILAKFCGPNYKWKSCNAIFRSVIPQNITLNEKQLADLKPLINVNLLKSGRFKAKQKNVNTSKASKIRKFRNVSGITTSKIKVHSRHSSKTNKSSGHNQQDGTNILKPDEGAVDEESETFNATAENENEISNNAVDRNDSISPLNWANIEKIETSDSVSGKDVFEDFEFLLVEDNLNVVNNIIDHKEKTPRRPWRTLTTHINDPMGETSAGVNNLKKLKDFIVSFQILEPFHCHENIRRHKFLQEIVVLGDQTLTHIRDKIICPSDFQDIQGDLSEAPDTPVTRLTRDVYKSAMFYIDNTFYIDRRHCATEDYSQVIQEWARPRGIPVGDTFDMCSQFVKKLKVRFDYPYVFVHQGCCEHLVIISDASPTQYSRLEFSCWVPSSSISC